MIVKKTVMALLFAASTGTAQNPETIGFAGAIIHF
jgi:hypothetical protein